MPRQDKQEGGNVIALLFAGGTEDRSSLSGHQGAGSSPRKCQLSQKTAADPHGPL